MASLMLPIINVAKETTNVISIHLEKRNIVFPFVAGQFMRVILPQLRQLADDPRGNGRFFSIASQPDEPMLMFATKTSESPFKQTIAKLGVGENVMIDGPFGKFILTQDTEKQHVLLSGGIGITPFRSMIKDATERKLPHRIILLYANHTPQDIVFKDDLDYCAKENPNLTIIYTITRPSSEYSSSKASAESRSNNNVYWKIGRIDEIMIKEYVKDLNNAIFYICGLPSMVDALSGLVKGMGITDENVKLERFTGYQ